MAHRALCGADPGPASSSWLSQWRPLRCKQHGDLNAANVLVDVRGTPWLIGRDAAALEAMAKEFNALAEPNVASAVETLRARGATSFVLDLRGAAGPVAPRAAAV